jgi:gluconolactonase
MPIEQVAHRLERIIDLGQEVEWLAGGFGGDGSALGVPWWPAEGPVWIQEEGYLLFSDIGQNRRMRYNDADGLSVFQEGTNEANGLTRDPQGRLLACEHDARRVTRQEADGSVTVVADRYDGKRLNRPNDLVVKSDGAIYFTDPYRDTYPGMELGFPGVYRVAPDLSDVTLLANGDDYVGPNGLCFSPGESTLYVNDSRVGLIKAWDVKADGGIEHGRLLIAMADERPGVPDGMKCDLEGNIYSTGPGGVWIIAPDGRHLGTIALGDGRRATNVGFGGGDWKTLYITTFEELGRVRVNIPGVAVPRVI